LPKVSVITDANTSKRHHQEDQPAQQALGLMPQVIDAPERRKRRRPRRGWLVCHPRIVR
jgi:hypothetical protein